MYQLKLFIASCAQLSRREMGRRRTGEGEEEDIWFAGEIEHSQESQEAERARRARGQRGIQRARATEITEKRGRKEEVDPERLGFTRNSIPLTFWELPNLLPCGRLQRSTFKEFGELFRTFK
jgi:ribosome assembly protein YihI (activator of Der GTPase)